MSDCPPHPARRLLGSVGLLVGVFALGCQAEVDGSDGSGASMGTAATPGSGGGGPAGAGGSSGAGVGGSVTTGGAGGAAGSPTGGTGGSLTGGTGGTGGSGATTACVGSPLTTPKRVVRLTEYQLFNSYVSIFGEAAAGTIVQNEQEPSLTEREFPPISGGIGVSAGMFALYDRMAQSAMAYVAANAATLTTCGATPTDAACVQQYLLSLAAKAFRRPVTPEEQTAITGQFWTEMGATGATVAQQLAYGVYGVLSMPSFIYRSELGTDTATDGPITQYELATSLSMFLTDRPPDADLLAAAAGNALGTAEQVRTQVTRILATPEARANLEMALIKYFKLTNAPTVILNADVTPGLTVTGGLQSSIYHEGELFMQNHLWSGGPLANLLTTRQTWTSAQVATQIYNVAAPAQVDADGFGLVELPADRAGLLTLSTFLLSGSRSNGSSPVTRGLAVNASIVCEVNPAFPEVIDPNTGMLGPDPEVEAAILALANESEIVRAQYRATTPKCVGCHSAFDAFGMVLEPFDAIGRSRTMDLAGRPIDATWTTTVLPDSVGGTPVTNAVEAATALAANGALDRCLAMNLINYALTEVSQGGANNTDLAAGPQTASCAVQRVIDAFAATDKSFTSLIREIAASETLAVRSRGL